MGLFNADSGYLNYFISISSIILSTYGLSVNLISLLGITTLDLSVLDLKLIYLAFKALLITFCGTLEFEKWFSCELAIFSCNNCIL